VEHLWAWTYFIDDTVAKYFWVWLICQEILKENVSPNSLRSRKVPLVRVHPVTGWKSLFINRSATHTIDGMEPAESTSILNHLFHVYESNPDIQIRVRWTAQAGIIAMTKGRRDMALG